MYRKKHSAYIERERDRERQREFSTMCGFRYPLEVFYIYLLSFPGGTVVENLPANAGDTGSSPGLGRSHMPRSN